MEISKNEKEKEKEKEKNKGKENEDENPLSKSIYPNLDSNKFQSIKESINNKKDIIGKSLHTFYYDYGKLSKIEKKENKPIIKNKKNIRKNQIKLFFKPKRNERVNFFGKTQNIQLPKENFIKKMQKNLNQESYIDQLFKSNDQIKSKESFFNSMLNTGENSFNQTTQTINNNNKIKRNKTLNNMNKYKSRNFNNNFLKSIRKLDYDNGKIYNHIKREKDFYNNIKNNIDEKYRAYHWKFIMTQNEKDLRPDTFFGKAGEEVLSTKSFNKQLDSMINNLRNVDAVNINVHKKRKEHSEMEEILKKRIQDEKLNWNFIKNILDKNQLIRSLIMKK